MVAGAGTELSSAELFTSYRTRIRRYIGTMVHDPDDADDLTQDVFVQAHRRLGSLRDPDAVVSWLYRIATHLAYDRFRKWSRQPSVPLPDVAGESEARLAEGKAEPSVGRVVEQAEMSACVRRYLDGLSDDYRTAILLHDLEGLTNVEIAEMLGVSLEAVKIRLHRARRKLEDALATHCDFSRDEQGVFVCEPTASVYPSAPSGRPDVKRRGAQSV
jgi:RNA polymerase sigma-70 factor (ECF subfamily)